jgi:polyisoprenoid-binding protein YceI
MRGVMKALTRVAVVWGLGMAATASAEPRVYVVVPEQSQALVQVGRAGLFKFAGHEHEVAAPVASGQVVADEADLTRSSVTLSFQAGALKVTGRGEPAQDVPKVQEKMLGPEALDVARHPTISFQSTAVSGRAAGPQRWEIQVEGDLTLHGVTRRITLPLQVQRAGDALTVTGQTVIRHTDYGMKPISVAGVVKVKNELTLDFRIAARAQP